MSNGNGDFSLRQMLAEQTQRVLVRGQRFGRFDQIRQRHFWSSYLFVGSSIAAGAYEIFKSIPGYIGQGYAVPLTIRETNWMGAGRVPDNQNIVITEIGVTLKRPPAAWQFTESEGVLDENTPGQPFNPPPPQSSIASSMSPAQVAVINGMAPILPFDAAAILNSGVLEMSFLTNNVPIGRLSDFSQSAGVNGFTTGPYGLPNISMHPGAITVAAGNFPPAYPAGDPVNGVPAAAFRRRLEVPILLQHGENCGMRINFPRDVQLAGISAGSTGWYEIRVDWWATESFAELS